MTQQPTPPLPPAGAPHVTPAVPPDAPKRNGVGLVAVLTSAVGFIFACIPGALVVGWILLPVGFILGIVAVTRKGQKKGTGVAAIIVSVVGTIVGVIVFVGVAAGAFSDALDEGAGGVATVVTDDGAQGSSESDDNTSDSPTDKDAEVVGTRDNPGAFGDVLENDNWAISLTGFNADANDEVADANQFNDVASDGTQWVTVDVAATYSGAETGSVLELSFNYVTTEGTVVGMYDSSASGLEPEFDGLAELYEGGSEDGKIAFLVPDSVDGLIRVTPGLFADDTFFALPTE